MQLVAGFWLSSRKGSHFGLLLSKVTDLSDSSWGSMPVDIKFPRDALAYIARDLWMSGGELDLLIMGPSAMLDGTNMGVE